MLLIADIQLLYIFRWTQFELQKGSQWESYDLHLKSVMKEKKALPITRAIYNNKKEKKILSKEVWEDVKMNATHFL